MRPQPRLTYEDYRQLPDDGQRYEVLDGELVASPSPNRRHQQLSKRLKYYLYRHVEIENRLGEIYSAPFEVVLADDTFVQPDLIFVAQERQDLFTERGLDGAPDLVVEILSPSTRSRDRGIKRALYARFGVRELWLVEPDTCTVDLHELTEGELVLARTFGRDDTLVSRALPELRLDLVPVFAPDA